MKTPLALVILPVVILVLAGCQDNEIAVPAPAALTNDSVGVYCGMILTEHAGPKAQVFEKFRKDPQWFSSVRDAVNYLTLPGEAQDAIAVYVHDMGRAESWEKPQNEGIWILASDAFFVVGSRKLGGMGTPELVPFGEEEQAGNFAIEYGGRVVRIADITSEDLISEIPDASNSTNTNANEKGLAHHD